jgi:hypothetical protein
MMHRVLPLALVFTLVIASLNCGTVFVGGALGTVNVQTASGLVSVVQLTVIVSQGMPTQVTLVILLLNGSATTFTFCGDQRRQFPPDQFVRASFNPGQPCANVLSIVIIGSEKTPTPTPLRTDLRDLASTRYLRDLGPSYA